MNTFKKLGLIPLLAVALSGSAYALSITPTTGTDGVTRWDGDETSQSEIDSAISPIIGNATELYKQNVGGSESGPFAGSYNTVFLDTPTDPSGATITYTGGPIIPEDAFMLVKDGNQEPAWYLYNLTALGWDGMDQLDLSGFWPNQGAISHIAFYSGGGTSVPDGGATVVLLGLGLTALALVRRKLT
jgi:hypothetical protein